MSNPFKTKTQIPISQQKQLSFPSGEEGAKTGKALFEGNAGVIDKSIAQITYVPNMKICDIGCGPGYSLIQLADKFEDAEVIGVDPSELMCNQAATNNDSNIKSGRVKILCEATPNLSFDEEYFDYALLANVVYFWNDPVPHFEEILRILKNSGKLIIYMTDKESLSKRISESDGVFNMYENKEVMDMLEKAGFKQISKKPITRKINQTGFILVATK